MNLSPKLTQKLAWGFIWAAGIVAVLVLTLIIGYILFRGIPVISPEFLFTEPEGGLSGEGGISSCIVTTLWLVVTTMVILIPLGIGAAIYLAEYAPDNRFTRLIRYSIELLAARIKDILPKAEILHAKKFRHYSEDPDSHMAPSFRYSTNRLIFRV